MRHVGDALYSRGLHVRGHGTGPEGGGGHTGGGELPWVPCWQLCCPQERKVSRQGLCRKRRGMGMLRGHPRVGASTLALAGPDGPVVGAVLGNEVSEQLARGAALCQHAQQ